MEAENLDTFSDDSDEDLLRGEELLREQGGDEKGSDDDGHWSDWDSIEPEGDSFKSLFCFEWFPTAEECFDYDRDMHGWDLRSQCREHGWDFYACVRVVNLIRKTVDEEGAGPSEAIERVAKQDWKNDDKLLIPVLPEDSVLLALEFAEDDEVEDRTEEAAEQRETCVDVSETR